MMESMLLQSEWFQLSFWSPLLTMLALMMIGLLYFLAPVLGYTPYNRGLLLGSMWTLVVKMALTIFKMGVFFLAGPSQGGMNPQNQILAGQLFPILESTLLILAMALFVGGLASLRRDQDRMSPPSHRSFTND